jgi:prolipoprotein diacylglyceryltransferase
MIPYFPQPVWSLGPWQVHAFGAAAAVALLSGYWLILSRAKSRGVNSTKAGTVFVIVLVAALACGLAVGRGRAVAGSGFAAGGGAALLLCAWGERSWNILDLIGGAVPLMNVVVRIGCFLAHDHVGRPTTAWLGVQFPGGARFDLGLLYAVAAAAVALAMEWISRADPPPGVTFGFMVASMAITRVVVLRFADPIDGAEEIFAGLMFAAGCQLIVARWRMRARPAKLTLDHVHGEPGQ